MGTGSHFHALLNNWTGEEVGPSCGCLATIKAMDAHAPAWSLDNMVPILDKVVTEGKRRHWWMKVVAAVPGHTVPLRWMLTEAARLATADLDSQAKETT